MGIQAPAKVKFALIYEAIQHDDNVPGFTNVKQYDVNGYVLMAGNASR